MKTSILMTALAIMLSTAIFATPSTEIPETTRTLKLASKFTTLTLTNVKIVLTNGEESDLYITGNQEAAKKIDILLDGSELMIDGTDLGSTEDVVIHVSSRLVNKLALFGKAEVTSNEILRNQEMDVVVNGDCKVKIKVSGKVNVSAADGYDYDYKFNKIPSELASKK